MPDWVAHKVDILVDLDKVGLAVDNLDSAHVADKGLAVEDSLDFVVALVLAGAEHLVFPVDRGPEDPDWKQSDQQKMSVEAPEDLHGSYPPVADSVVAGEPGYLGVETKVEHQVEMAEAAPQHQEGPLPVQPIDSDQEFALEDHALDHLRVLEADPVRYHWEELHALEDHYHVEAHEAAAEGPECCVADQPDWPDTLDFGATLHGTTCTRALYPCFESPESFE